MNPQLLSILNQAISHFQQNDLLKAESSLNKILQLDSNNPPALQILGLVKAGQGHFREASKLLKKAAKLNPNDPGLLYNLAKVLSDSGDEVEAVIVHEKLLKLAPNNPNAWINYSKSLANTKKFTQALVAIEKAIEFDQNNAEAWNNKGAILKEIDRIDDALNAYAKALLLNPLFAEPSYNQGIAFLEQKKYLDAIDCFDKALMLRPDYLAAFNNKGIALTNLGRHEEALLAFDSALSLKHDYIEGSINKAVTLMHLRKFEEAIKTLSTINEFIPNNSAAWNNKGAILLELKRHSEALNCFEKATNLQPLNPEALVNLGQTLIHLKRFDKAIEILENAHKISPDYKSLEGLLLGAKMQICNWENFSENLESLEKLIDSGKVAAAPFTLLSLTGDEDLHQKAAISYVNSLHPPKQHSQASEIKNQNGKIKLGYYSADFHNHATGFLIAELFELHDREKFELFAFSFGPNTQDEMQLRISSAFDHFINVSEKSDSEITNLSRDLSIQIAVDLKGLTLDSRPGIFANRAAPIQISYLGYPGTMGADYIDYIIADKVVIPVESQKSYIEKVLYLPNCYQINDSKRQISNKHITRSEFGLPDDSFVYCCFNNNYKISPNTFKTWMNILKRVENSVLWLFEDNEFAAKNLQSYAQSFGIKSNRLIFAKLIPLSEHLARHHLADLFLDTLPYNAHTTASDALWSGLPVLTLLGSSFAGRVSASLLTAIGLQDLIMHSPEEYENRAVYLANNPEELNQLRAKLLQNKYHYPLFDSKLFTKDIENIYISALNNSSNT